jgi:hypothetical protein
MVSADAVGSGGILNQLVGTHVLCVESIPQKTHVCVEDLFHSVKLANSWVLHACLVCMP